MVTTCALLEHINSPQKAALLNQKCISVDDLLERRQKPPPSAAGISMLGCGSKKKEKTQHPHHRAGGIRKYTESAGKWVRVSGVCVQLLWTRVQTLEALFRWRDAFIEQAGASMKKILFSVRDNRAAKVIIKTRRESDSNPMNSDDDCNAAAHPDWGKLFNAPDKYFQLRRARMHKT